MMRPFACAKCGTRCIAEDDGEALPCSQCGAPMEPKAFLTREDVLRRYLVTLLADARPASQMLRAMLGVVLDLGARMRQLEADHLKLRDDMLRELEARR